MIGIEPLRRDGNVTGEPGGPGARGIVRIGTGYQRTRDARTKGLDRGAEGDEVIGDGGLGGSATHGARDRVFEMELDLLIRYGDRGSHGCLLDGHRAAAGSNGELGCGEFDGGELDGK